MEIYSSVRQNTAQNGVMSGVVQIFVSWTGPTVPPEKLLYVDRVATFYCNNMNMSCAAAVCEIQPRNWSHGASFEPRAYESELNFYAGGRCKETRREI